MNRAMRAAAWAALMAISVGLSGCGDDSDRKAEPPAAQPATQPEAPYPGDPEDGTQASSGEADRTQERIARLIRERDEAASKASAAAGNENWLRAQLEDERKAAANLEARRDTIVATLTALRERLVRTGQDDWVVRVEAEAFETQKDVQVREHAEASGGKALLFDRPTSAIETVIDAPAGSYRVVPVGMAPDGGEHDALELTVKALDEQTGRIDLTERIFCDREWDKFVGASNSPAIVVERAGRLRVGLRVTDETGVLLDRVELRVHLAD